MLSSVRRGLPSLQRMAVLQAAVRAELPGLFIDDSIHVAVAAAVQSAAAARAAFAAYLGEKLPFTDADIYYAQEPRGTGWSSSNELRIAIGRSGAADGTFRNQASHHIRTELLPGLLRNSIAAARALDELAADTPWYRRRRRAALQLSASQVWRTAQILKGLQPYWSAHPTQSADGPRV